MNAPVSGDVIDGDLFAANANFTDNYLDAGGAYDRMLQELDWTGLRFPGGTITESLFAPGSDFVERFFDVTRPSGLAEDGSDRIVTVPAAFDYVAQNDLSFDFTLPSKQYLTDEVDDEGNRVPSQFGLYRLLDRTDQMIRGNYGEIDIQSFEIGNEFWYPENSITAEEYGLLANDLSVGLQALFDVYEEERGGPDAWEQPLIAVQAAPGWLQAGNQPIFDEMTLAARGAVDSAITHFYPGSYTGAGSRAAHFDRLDEWQDLEGVDQDLAYFVSEWNMQNGSDTGLVQASGVLEAMRTMIERNVDFAAVWGTQYYNLGSRLAALEDDPDAPGGRDYTLTASGELFRMMSEDLKGLQLLDLDTPPDLRNAIDVPQEDRTPAQAEQLVMHAFADADTTVVFISSRSDIAIDVTVDPAELVPDYHHVWGQQLGVIDDPATGARDEGDPFSQFAEPYIQTHDQSALTGPDGLSVTLQPYEILQLEFTTGETGVEMSGHDYVVDPAADYDDDLQGTNFDDMISGEAGDDTLRGHAGDDSMSGGAGDDFLGGWVGDDLLDGGAGDDTLIGGAGADTLIAREGVNELRGTDGTDQFIVDPAGETQIFDFGMDGGEGLSFLDIYDTPQDVLDRAATEGEDLIVNHDAGGQTRLVGLGGREDDLAGVLTDFQPEAPVGALVDQINTPPPDGSVQPDPGSAPDDGPTPPITRDEINELLSFQQPEEVAEFLRALTPEEEDSLLDQINGNALALSNSVGLWGAFVNNLSDEGFARLMDEVDDTILDMRLARITAETYANGAETSVEGGDPIGRSLSETGEEVRLDLYLALSDADRDLLEQLWGESNPDRPDLSAAEILQLDPVDVEDRRAELQATDEKPLFAEFLLPDTYDKDYLAQQIPEDDEDDDPAPSPDGGGGGCFVATCAYGDEDHADVIFLRLYRDLELSGHAPGRAFISAYYRLGPWLAAAIAPFPWLRRLARGALAALVRAMRSRRRAT